MELTITFFIKFTLIVHFVLVLFFNRLSLLHFNGNFNRYVVLHFFSKISHFRLLSNNYPIRGLIIRSKNFIEYNRFKSAFLA